MSKHLHLGAVGMFDIRLFKILDFSSSFSILLLLLALGARGSFK